MGWIPCPPNGPISTRGSTSAWCSTTRRSGTGAKQTRSGHEAGSLPQSLWAFRHCRRAVGWRPRAVQCKGSSTSPATRTPRPQRRGSSPPRWAATPTCRASPGPTRQQQRSTTGACPRPLGLSCPPTSTGSGHGSRPMGSPGRLRLPLRLPLRGGHRTRSAVPRASKVGASGGLRAQVRGVRSQVTVGAGEPQDTGEAPSPAHRGARVLRPGAPRSTVPHSPTVDTLPGPCRAPSSHLAAQRGRGARGAHRGIRPPSRPAVFTPGPGGAPGPTGGAGTVPRAPSRVRQASALVLLRPPPVPT